jgi:glycosyltransferase involved in cell wall biosynthesis
MRILVLSPRPCQPANTGGKLREFHILRQLAPHARIRLLAFHTSGSPFTLDFASVSSFPRPPRYTAGKVLRSLATGTPLSILNYRSAEFAAALAAALEPGAFDLVWFESIHMAAYLPEIEAHAPRLPRVWNWHNIESELLFRYAAAAPSPVHALYARFTGRQLAQFEGRALACPRALHLFCSQREIDQLQPAAPQARLALIPNGVDTASFTPAPLGSSRTLLFVGSLDYAPNIAGLTYFTRDVWPALRERYPDARLEIVGSNPVPAVTALASLPGVHLAVSVPSVAPYYQNARAAIVPLFSGAGTRLKILESFAAGVPVVSSAIGIEGIDATAGVHYLPADSTAAWIDALSRLLDSAQTAHALAREASALAAGRYDWSIACQPLPALLKSLAG